VEWGYSVMSYCSCCGKRLSDDTMFCYSCGKPIIAEQRRSIYDGIIHKCSNCGEVLNGFVGNCPTCGYEIRGVESSDAIRKFSDDLVNAENKDRKAEIIRNCPIPNTKEDILEFMIMTLGNVENELSKEILSAWRSKLEQIYQKASIIFVSEFEFSRINTLYGQALKKIKRGEKKQQVKNVGNILTELVPVLPNIALVIAWVISIFVLISLSGHNLDNAGFNPMQLFLMLDLFVGVIFIPKAIKCKSNMPRMVTVVGLIISIIVLIILSSTNIDEVGFNAYQLILIVDIICSTCILVKGFRVGA